ncbi:hypothetical protein HY988_06910 [Candidatus Micrarchaeota archaeon]|nr:hypothetical protein [Candidatus Micrarchaeota archaeon]
MKKLFFILFILVLIFSINSFASNCQSNKDCAPGEACAFRLQPVKGFFCQPQAQVGVNCQDDTDCLKAKPVCDLNTNKCVVKGKPQPIQNDCANNGEGTSCKVDVDCAKGQFCIAGFCKTGATAAQFEQQTQASPFEVVKSWQAISILALVVSIIFMAIAYAIGTGFELVELKAWASTEAVQIVSTAIIIMVLIGTMIFVDTLVSAMIKGSNVNIACNPGEPCLVKVGISYLNDYTNLATDSAKGVLRNNIDAAAQANRRFGLYCLTIYCAQLGISTTFAGQYILDQDLYSLVFEYYGNILSSLESQRFFLNNVSANAGPVILALGIASRSFFVTRKLGGLLIAIAVGIMFFLPGMYLFNWVTLDTVLNGDKGVSDFEQALCPAECSTAPPLAVIDLGNGNYQPLKSVSDVYTAFARKDSTIAMGIVNGTIPNHLGTNCTNINQNILSCASPSDTNDCPTLCRELPYSSNPICANSSNLNAKGKTAQQSCALVPEYCKVKRLVDMNSPTFDKVEYGKCPASCKVVPPLKSDCNVKADGITPGGTCLQSRFDCRVYQRTNDPNKPLVWAPQGSQQAGNSGACAAASDCAANLDAAKSCSYVLPQSGSCDDLCTVGGKTCPQYCRVTGPGVVLPLDCNSFENIAACKSCPESCNVNIGAIPPKAFLNNCTVGGTCPLSQRIISSPLPPSSLDQNSPCYINNCLPEYRAVVPTSACQACIFTDESYAYTPPINTRCNDLCGPPNNAPVKSSGEYTKIGQEGLVGRAEIQGVAKLMIPAYLLPLFDIVATLAFIKGVSVILGGDIDIPGISKVF